MLYWTELRPVITYSSKSWELQESIKRKLLITERTILRRIFGPTKDRKIKTTDELSNLIRNKNIIKYIKAQRLSWFGHVHWMTNDRMFKKLYACQSISTRQAGRPKIIWENDIREDFKIMKKKETKCIHDRVKWKELADKAKNFKQLSCSAWWRIRTRSRHETAQDK